MTAEDIQLAPQPKEKPTTPKLKEVPAAPIPITEAELEELKKLGGVITQDGIKIYGATSAVPDLSDIPLRVCCHCERFDLSDKSDRTKYAELKNSASAVQSAIQVDWEEMAKDGTSLVVYLTYFEYLRAVERKHV